MWVLACVAQSHAPWCHCVPPSQYLEGWSDTSPLCSGTSVAASTCHSDIDPTSHNILFRLKKLHSNLFFGSEVNCLLFILSTKRHDKWWYVKNYNDGTLVYSSINVFMMAPCNHLWKYDLICCGSIVCSCSIDSGYLAFSIHCILFFRVMNAIL